MYQSIRPLLFKLEPERIHSITLRLIQLAGQLPPTYALLKRMFEVDDPRLEVEAFGLKFKNPIGLAAGYDKNGVAVKGLSALGFGHVEVGTVTQADRQPQAARASRDRSAGRHQQYGLSQRRR